MALVHFSRVLFYVISKLGILKEKLWRNWPILHLIGTWKTVTGIWSQTPDHLWTETLAI